MSDVAICGNVEAGIAPPFSIISCVVLHRKNKTSVFMNPFIFIEPLYLSPSYEYCGIRDLGIGEFRGMLFAVFKKKMGIYPIIVFHFISFQTKYIILVCIDRFTSVLFQAQELGDDFVVII